MKKLSIKVKITIWYTLAMILVSAVAVTVMVTTTREVLVREEIGMLINVVNDSTRRIMMRGGNLEFDRGFRHEDGGVSIIVYDKDKNIINGSLPDGVEDTERFENGRVEKLEEDGDYYSFTREIPVPVYGSIWVRGIKSAAGANALLNSIMRNNILTYFAIIVAAALGGFILLKKALTPVEKISETAEKISSSNNLSKRIALGEGKDEIYTLANTFDNMLEKIEKSFEKEKQFTSDASHELRTPITVIMSECDYADSCELTNEEYAEIIQTIGRQAKEMSKLVSSLLAISRMDVGTQKVNAEEFDMSELVEIICEEQKSIGNQNTTLDATIESGVFVCADKTLIARLLINLISNAYKYGKEGGFVKISLRSENENAVVTVADDGVGIAEENIDKIWDRFYREDSSRTDSKSFGLGLSMVKWIAQAHGGEVTVQSEKGKGTVFTFTMPKGVLR